MMQIVAAIAIVVLVLFSDQRGDPATLLDVWWALIFALGAGLVDDVLFSGGRK